MGITERDVIVHNLRKMVNMIKAYVVFQCLFLQ